MIYIDSAGASVTFLHLCVIDPDVYLVELIIYSTPGFTLMSSAAGFLVETEHAEGHSDHSVSLTSSVHLFSKLTHL